MNAYIISLYAKESDKNRLLFSILEKNGFKAHLINAINGPLLDAKTYFFLTQKYFKSTKKLLTPSELGCSLSHKIALEEILRAGVSSALVLEDDVILDDAACTELKKIINQNFTADGFVHLGGQEGLESNFRNLGGIQVNDHPKVFEVNPDDLCWLHRTVGYLISSKNAEKILNLLNDHPVLIDDFSYIRIKTGISKFYFSKIVGHPSDLFSSTIEEERATRSNFIEDSSTGLPKRIMSEIKKTIDYRRKIFKAKRESKYKKII